MGLLGLRCEAAVVIGRCCRRWQAASSTLGRKECVVVDHKVGRLS